MRRPLIAACVALAALGALFGCSSAPTNARPSATLAAVNRPGITFFPVTQRQPAPDLKARTLAGQLLAADDVRRGGVLVLNVWAAWCVECRAESRTLAELHRRLAPRGVRFLGIDEQDNPRSARSFVVKARPGYPSLVDQDGSLLAKLVLLPNTGIPSTLVIDRSGRMAGRIVGQVQRNALLHLIDRVAAD
jgi:peroxiredoxin